MSPTRFAPPLRISMSPSLRRTAVSGLGVLREARARAGLAATMRGRGPLAVLLPSGPPEGAALLRIYNMADALRSLGWRTAVLPAKLSLAARRRYLAAAGPDVVVMQGARHDLNRPHLYPDQRIVYDIDDADFHLPHLAAPVSQAMTAVAAVMAGSRYIADWALKHGAPAAHVIWTGTPPSLRPRPPQAGRGPVVAWAQTRPMTYRREAALVSRVMAGVAQHCPGVTLRLYDRRPGDDPGFAAGFQHPGLSVDWRDAQPYEAYLATFDDVALGLAPLCPETPFSRGKSFGKVLAYLDSDVPVVGSAAGEHRAFFTPATGVITNDVDIWIDEIRHLLTAPAARQRLADAARRDFARHLSVEAAAAGVVGVLDAVIGRPVRQPATKGESAAGLRVLRQR